MKQKVPNALVDVLNNRIYLSRTTKIFSIPELAASWEVSRMTLFRYYSPRYREISRIAARRTTETQMAIDKSLCQICGQKLRGHLRCESCTMLQHGEPECSCNRCIDIHLYSKLFV